MSQRIVIDPVTRIEGHLRVDVEVADGRVAKAWVAIWRCWTSETLPSG